MSASRNLLCSDLDGTLLGDAAALAEFGRQWTTFSRRTGAKLAYVTGRTVEDVLKLLDELPDLPRPDAIAGDVGTSLYLPPETRWDDPYHARLSAGWNRKDIERILERYAGIRRQPEINQGRFKCSWLTRAPAPASVKALEMALILAGLQCRVVYSDDRFVDILPAAGGKGAAVRRLAEYFDIPFPRVLVAGDTGNDADMFAIPGVRGVIVANAHAELAHAVKSVPSATVHHAAGPHAAGVLEGCRIAFGPPFASA